MTSKSLNPSVLWECTSSPGSEERQGKKKDQVGDRLGRNYVTIPDTIKQYHNIMIHHGHVNHFWSILIRGVAPKTGATDVKVPPKDRLQAMVSPTLRQPARDMESYERTIGIINFQRCLYWLYIHIYSRIALIAQQAWCFLPVAAAAGRREFRWGMGLRHQLDKAEQPWYAIFVTFWDTDGVAQNF